MAFYTARTQEAREVNNMKPIGDWVVFSLSVFGADDFVRWSCPIAGALECEKRSTPFVRKMFCNLMGFEIGLSIGFKQYVIDNGLCVMGMS